MDFQSALGHRLPWPGFDQLWRSGDCAASPGPDAEYHGAFLVRLLFFGHKPGHNPTAPG